MDKIFELVKDPAFWFGAAIVGTIINIVAAYFKDAIDKLWARYSKSRMAHLRATRDARYERISLMANEPAVLQVYRHLELRQNLVAIQYLIMSLVFLAVLVLVSTSYSASVLKDLIAIGSLLATLLVSAMGAKSALSAQHTAAEITEALEERTSQMA